MARLSLPWNRRERFSAPSISDPAFAAWFLGPGMATEMVTPYTVLGLSAVIRAVSIISTTIAGLPLRTFEKDDTGERVRIPSVFDDPWSGIEGQTPFEWVETTLIHLLLWREAFLWHESRDPGTGEISAYRPINPDAFEPVRRVNGKRRFTYTDADGAKQTVGSEAVTYIPGPSLDGTSGHPLLYAARAIFSAALSGDKAAQSTLARGIRIAGILTPEDGETVDDTEGEQILEALRARLLGEENAGDVVLMNKHMKLTPWEQSNVDNQWHETRQDILGEVGRLFGIPPHLLNDIEKQTSWGTGVAEQNLGLARFTLMGWSSRVEQRLSLRLPAGQFVEFDYKGLLQGTPAEEIALVIEQLDAGLISLDYATRVLNLPAPTAAQRAAIAQRSTPAPTASGFAQFNQPAEPSFVLNLPDQRPEFHAHVATPPVHVDAPVTVHTPESPVTVTIEPGAVAVSAPVTVEPAQVHVAAPEVRNEITVAPTPVEISVEPTPVTVESPTVEVRNEITVDPTPLAVNVEAPSVQVTNEIAPPAPSSKRIERDADGRIVGITDSEESR